ncbi:MAG TPA: hypothetical protein PL004_12475 [Bacillota bacterium]|nr:hypothetical protein [Bacillota bacterium]
MEKKQLAKPSNSGNGKGVAQSSISATDEMEKRGRSPESRLKIK